MTEGSLTEAARLTELTSCGGCAAKYSAGRLEQLLGHFAAVDDANLLVGLAKADDAAVYRLDDERAIVFTVDFFPPIVDDARTFGAIAATNALNDVFAMGGTPLLALSVAAFPEELATEVVADVLAGAEAKVRQAGALLAGGHTIRDNEPKYGLAVVGTVSPRGVWTKSSARPGDVLFLTKPLGTGLIMSAHGQGRIGADSFERALEWMTTLNDAAAAALRPLDPSAVTDVTGFGLFGHAHEMASRSNVGFVLEAESLPAMDGALDAARMGVRTGGDPRNRDFAAGHVTLDGVPDAAVTLGYDPQTAGGLLAAVARERAVTLEAEFARRGLFLRRIGEVVEGAGVTVTTTLS